MFRCSFYAALSVTVSYENILIGRVNLVQKVICLTKTPNSFMFYYTIKLLTIIKIFL